MKDLIEALTVFKENGFYATADFDGLGVYRTDRLRLDATNDKFVNDRGFSWREDTREYYAHRDIFN